MEPTSSEEKRQTNSGEGGSPYDLNGVQFNPEMFIQKVIKDYPLSKLMETESNLIRQIQDLDSDMQTLVYENYNKFILATDTIRKMKTDFREMEDKMGLLSSKISLITDNSSQISDNLKEKRDKVNKLSSIHDLLKKLKFLFELPTKLKQLSEENNYEEAVRCYKDGVEFVSEFKRFPSLIAIKQDCQHIVVKIREDLYKDFEDSEMSSQDLTRNVNLLLSLGESPSTLGNRFLANAAPKLNQNLDSMSHSNNSNVPIDEYMELGCGIYLSNLSLVIASFSHSFIQATELSEESRRESQDNLHVFVKGLMDKFFNLMEGRLLVEVKQAHEDHRFREYLLHALDRLHRRLMALGTLMPKSDFALCGLDLISKVSQADAALSLENIKKSFEVSMKEACRELRSQPGSTQELLGSILATFISQLKLSLKHLQEFSRSEFHFAQSNEFQKRLAHVTVREQLVVASFRYLADFGSSFISGDDYDNLTWLLASKLFLDIEVGTVGYIINAVEVDFDMIKDKRSGIWKSTSVSELTQALNSTSKALIKEFIIYQGNQLSELLKKAVLNKDLISIQKPPEGPQPEMKKIVEILTILEKHLDSIFPDMDVQSYMKSERSSDSSKRSYSVNPSSKSLPRPPLWSNLDPNMANNIQKLFSEKVEIFSQVDFHKSDILMMIIKIGLRAFLEFVRLKTISKYGVHQIQVDVHYLQLYLWRFVNNESFMHSLLDEILASSIQRCINPCTLLDTSALECLAEK